MLGGEPWDYHGNKVRYHLKQSDIFSYRSRCPKNSYTPSRCADECVYDSAADGSPTAKTSSCSSNRVTIQWPISGRTMFLQMPWNLASTRPATPNSDSPRGISFEPASTARVEERGSILSCRSTRANYRDGWPSPGRPWTPSTRRTKEFWVMPRTATIES